MDSVYRSRMGDAFMPISGRNAESDWASDGRNWAGRAPRTQPTPKKPRQPFDSRGGGVTLQEPAEPLLAHNAGFRERKDRRLGRTDVRQRSVTQPLRRAFEIVMFGVLGAEEFEVRLAEASCAKMLADEFGARGDCGRIDGSALVCVGRSRSIEGGNRG